MSKIFAVCLVVLTAINFSTVHVAAKRCQANHTYAESVSACPRTCQRLAGSMCLAIIMKPGCYCSDGYVLKSKGSATCLLPKDCYIKPSSKIILQ